MSDNRTRPSSYETVYDVEARLTRKQLMTATWIPRGGNGLGLRNGKRVYYRNGKVSPGSAAVVQDLLIENPTELAKGTLDNALYAGKALYNLTRDTSNAVLGPVLSPWQIANQIKFHRAVKEEEADFKKSQELPPAKPRGDDYFDSDYTEKTKSKADALLISKRVDKDSTPSLPSNYLEPDYAYPEGEQVFEPGPSPNQGASQVVANKSPQNKVVQPKPEPKPEPFVFTPDPAELRRATGIDIKKDKGKKAWQRLVNSNQVFDTTKNFGKAGGYWVNDNRGIPRFVKYAGGQICLINKNTNL